jgi:hypothetical protein
MNSVGIQSAFGFDEKRDYEIRRMRRTDSTLSSASSSTYSEDLSRSRQSSCSSEYSDTSITPSGKPTRSRSVRFALSQHPTIPLSLTFTPLPLHTKRPSNDHTHTRKRSRADSTDNFAWWAQRRIQQDAEWSEERKLSEKETSGEQDVRHLWVKFRG